MKTYKELANKVFERRDKYLVARRRKRKKIIKRTSATVCALVVVLGLSAWHLEWFGLEPPTTHTQTGKNYLGDNSNHNDFEIELTTTTTKRSTTASEQATTTTVTTTEATTTGRTTTTNPLVQTTVVDGQPGKKYLGDSYRIVDWFEEDDIVHLLLLRRNRYLVINSNTGDVLRDITLAGEPSRMRAIDDELWISYSDLRAVYIYDKETFALKRQIDLEHEISSFDVYEDYLIYAYGEGGTQVYRYNMVTKESEYLNAPEGRNYKGITTYYMPDILVDADKGLVYVGESGTSGSGIYCFDIETREVSSYYLAPLGDTANYGLGNKIKKIYLVGDELYWAGLKLDPDDVSNILHTYRNASWVGTVYANEDYVITFDGLCDRYVYSSRTNELLYSQKSQGILAECLIITESGNFVYSTSASKNYVVIIPDWVNKK